MDTLQFFQKILPPEGVYYLVVAQKGKDGMAHKAFTSLEDMAEAVATYNAKPLLTVYHACASYKQEFITVGDKRKYRIPDNANSAKAFWIDLDVGADKAEKGKGYTDKKSACADVLLFCKKIGMPSPMIVDSGGGIHCYWPFEEAIPADDWRPLASQFKAILAHFGVKADPTRTADFASILRPAGSHNKKDAGNHREVTIKRDAPAHPVSTYIALLKGAVSAYSIEVEQVYRPKTALVPGLNDDLLAHAYPEIDSSAELAADKCKQLAMVRDTQGDVGYEHWFHAIGVISHCVEGVEAAIQWSAKRGETGHSQTDAQAKFHSWNAGPTKCSKFESINPEGCKGCKFKGQITSPIMLGRIEPEQQPETVEEVIIDNFKVDVVVPAMPQSYKFIESDTANKYGEMVKVVANSEGVLEPIPFALALFYPFARIVDAAGEFVARMRVHVNSKKVREFNIPMSVAIAGGQELVKALAARDVSISNHKGAAVFMSAYMRDALEALRRKSEELNTMTSFGWHDDMRSFLLGDRLYKSDGTVAKVILGGIAASRASCFPAPQGSVETWSDGVNGLYNRPRMEPMQYAICSGFGSVLSVFCENQYKGIPVALTGVKTGRGKTTACKAALYAFGNAEAITISGKDGSTQNARYGIMAAHKNIPLLVDEITHIKPEDLSALLYSMANGKAKDRMNYVGGELTIAESGTWRMSAYLTANSNMVQTLAASGNDSAAEAVRMIEINVDAYGTEMLDKTEAALYVGKIERNHGTAGDVFVRWCVQNTDEIAKRIKAMNTKLLTECPELHRSEFRFYHSHAICTLVAHSIAVDLNLLAFDGDALFSWTVGHIKNACADVKEVNTVDPKEAFMNMVNDLSPAIISTEEFRHGASKLGPETCRIGANVVPIGRYIRGNAMGTEAHAGWLILHVKAVFDWCAKHRIDRRVLLDTVKEAGWVITESERLVVTRGTDRPSSQTRCMVFDLHKACGVENVPQGLAVVVDNTKEKEVQNG